jgi:DNA-binding transcriptional ArsR family regulator
MDERKRGVGDALAYAVGHRIRLDALAILAEGRHSPNEIAAMLRKNVSTVARHIRELYESGCIEFIGTEQVRGATEHFYRAVALPEISDEEYRALSPEARLEIIGLIVQAILAETLASLEAGKLETDENLAMLWDCVPVDEDGRQEILMERTESYERMNQIKAANINRLAKARKEAIERGEKPPTGTTMIVTSMAFERSRPGRPERGYAPAPETDA